MLSKRAALGVWHTILLGKNQTLHERVLLEEDTYERENYRQRNNVIGKISVSSGYG